MMLSAYRFLTTVGAPFISAYLSKRLKKGKEHPTRFPERLGNATIQRPEGILIWMHGASVGEALSLMPLAEHMLSSRSDLSILLTTGTVTSAQLIEDKNTHDRLIHQFIPVDRIPFVRRFLEHWQPDLAVWVESDLWPNMVLECSNKNIPMALINARMSDKSFEKWQKYPKMIATLLGCFDLVLAQSEQDKKRLSKLGTKDALCYGNLKFAAPPLDCDFEELEKLQSLIKDRPLWMAASTHPGEELECVEVHLKLKEKHPDLLTIIAPRHPHRGDEIMQEISQHNVNVAQRSRRDETLENTGVYLTDTLGEMGLFYRLSSLVFIGKSLKPLGGQNPLEPAKLDCAVICGPYMTNFAEIMKEFEAENAVSIVSDLEQLISKLDNFIDNSELSDEMAERAKSVANSKKQIIEDVTQKLFDYVCSEGKSS